MELNIPVPLAALLTSYLSKSSSSITLEVVDNGLAGAFLLLLLLLVLLLLALLLSGEGESGKSG